MEEEMDGKKQRKALKEGGTNRREEGGKAWNHGQKAGVA
jgi:hypothetical protein